MPWRYLAFPLGLFLLSRFALLGLSFISMRLVPKLFEYENRRQTLLQGYPAIDGLCRWDCGLYIRIATHGYNHHTDGNIWPLLPALSKGLSLLTGLPIPFSVLVIANLAALMSFIVIYLVFFKLEGEKAAKYGLSLFVAYPFAYYQAAGYAESLMVLLTASAVLLAIQGHHVRAGAVLGLAVLARHLSALAGLALLAYQIADRGLKPGRLILSPAILGLGLPFVALGSYMFFLNFILNDPWAYLTSRTEGWGPQAWWGIFSAVRADWFNARHGLYLICSLLPGLGAFMLLGKKHTWPLAIFAISLILVCWLFGIEALGRYSAACWPAFLAWGVYLVERPFLRFSLFFISLFFQGMLAFLFMHQYPLL